MLFIGIPSCSKFPLFNSSFCVCGCNISLLWIYHFEFSTLPCSVRVKEGVDDATRARMNSEMKAIKPSESIFCFLFLTIPS
jgi:hypothetical protein